MPNQLQNRVGNYVGLLNKDIQVIQKNLNDTNTLIESTDPETIHGVAEALIHSNLGTNWVQVPRQYSYEDYYLIAMDRFMELSGVAGYSILLPIESEKVTLVMTDLNVPAAFAFETNQDQNGGAYFVELTSGERLFYWSMERKQIQFNARAIVDLLVANFANEGVTIEQNQIIANLLTEFGRYMERVFGYAVDFNILETRDDYIYNLIQHAQPQDMLDKLFVLSADTSYFLQGIPNGAAISLNDHSEIRIFFVNDANALGAQRWHFQVIDGRDQYSWLDILLSYDFIAKWYLSENKTLEIAYDQLVFAVQQSEKQDIQPIFAEQQGLTPMLPSEIEALQKQVREQKAAEQKAAEQKAAEQKAAAEAEAAKQAKAESAAATGNASENATSVGADVTSAETSQSEASVSESVSVTQLTPKKSFDDEIGEAVHSSSNPAEK
ncbi:hypothetical protein [Weissella minor]|uniref:Uncharacterized protein n=1 Tax=Weissella minor TaxID=1620 RepID=A0A0R2JKN4_9LACO|nr:hypothetical protein [Weissella minor]KRN77779.1 hypothetical protein IV67_GL001305 [Weissella minor]